MALMTAGGWSALPASSRTKPRSQPVAGMIGSSAYPSAMMASPGSDAASSPGPGYISWHRRLMAGRIVSSRRKIGDPVMYA